MLDFEQENKKLRETVPENEVASLQEQLAAAKLREAEANLALKELRSKVAELSGMWQKHLKRKNLVRKSIFYSLSFGHLIMPNGGFNRTRHDFIFSFIFRNRRGFSMRARAPAMRAVRPWRPPALPRSCSALCWRPAG